MIKANSKQLLLIAGGVLLTAALYFAPQKVSKTEVHQHEVSFESLNKEAKEQVKRQEAEVISQLEAGLKKDPESVKLNDSIAKVWDRLSMPQISSHYYENIALKAPAEKSWTNAAYRFFDASRLTGDSLTRKYFIDKAIASYQNVLKINPDNLDAKTDLGLCYAEGVQPMEGIKLLREVTEKNPEHEMAQYNLGILSLKSGQNEKAIARFEKVLQINPQNDEARFLLARTFVSLGKNDLALRNLDSIRNKSNPALNEQVSILINQINNH